MLRSEEAGGRKEELDASSEGVKRKWVKGHKESEVKNNSNQNQSYETGYKKSEKNVQHHRRLSTTRTLGHTPLVLFVASLAITSLSRGRVRRRDGR